MNTQIEQRLLISSLALLGIACGDPLKNAQEIEEPRVLGVQIEGSNGSATPRAGETATVRFLLAGPSGPQTAEVAYQICEAADSARGVPYCVGEIYAEGTIDAGSSMPEVEFTLSDDAAPGTRLAVLAAVCVSGSAELGEDPLDWTCAGGADPINVSFDGYTESDTSNDNPDLSGLVVEVGGEEIALEDADTLPSCDAGIPTVTRDKDHTLTISLPEEARESDEWLQVSHFSTTGKFERQYTILEPEESLEIEIDWTAPESAGPAKQYVVVRDGRGGVSFATWSVCAN